MLNRSGMKTRARDWALLTRARRLAALSCPHTYKAQTHFSFFAAQSNRIPNRTPDNPLSGSEETQCSGCNKTFTGGRDAGLMAGWKLEQSKAMIQRKSLRNVFKMQKKRKRKTRTQEVREDGGLASVQFSLSRVRLFATTRTAARQASLSITNSRSLLKVMSIQSVMPSTISCSGLASLPQLLGTPK